MIRDMITLRILMLILAIAEIRDGFATSGWESVLHAGVGSYLLVYALVTGWRVMQLPSSRNGNLA
jgi:hypothetical protein